MSGNSIRKWIEVEGIQPPPGLHRSGSPIRRLTELQARRALEMLAEGHGTSDIARMLDVTYHTIKDLRRGKTYKHLQRPPGLPRAA